MINGFEKIDQLAAKIGNLLEAVRKNGGRFSSIEKDLLTSYTRELYELTAAIDASPTIKSVPVAPPVTEQPQALEIKKLEEEVKPRNGIELNGTSKKSISEIYSEKNESTLNDKLKPASPSLMDQLKNGPIKDLKAYIGLNRQFSMVNALFNGDEKAYNKSIDELNNFANYESALNYIKGNLVSTYEWKDDDSAVNEFLTLVMRRYLV